MNICLKDFGVVCALGQSKQELFDNLIAGSQQGLVLDSELAIEEQQYVGKVDIPPEAVPEHIDSRNNQLAYLAFKQIEPLVMKLAEQFGRRRVAVVIGSSTSGIAEGEKARKTLKMEGAYPKQYHYALQELVAPAHFIADLSGAQGPAYTISTACSSSAKTLASARALIESGVADVVIAGGVDSMARLTVNGFKALESISKGKCAPFTGQRDGINIGEAAALFVLCKEQGGVQLLGVGETSDAYHVSAPHPSGGGAFNAMSQALQEAGIQGYQIDYVNLHGTGTVKNDEMEAKAMFKACGGEVPCGSTKGMTGHTLGAAGALEAGICWLLLSDINRSAYIPANVGEGEISEEFSSINISSAQQVEQVSYCMSNSFAFGGNNISLLLGNTDE